MGYSLIYALPRYNTEFFVAFIIKTISREKAKIGIQFGSYLRWRSFVMSLMANLGEEGFPEINRVYTYY